MDLEASLLERLEKLREWQNEQQEYLLRQQYIQREMLSQEQDRMYRRLGLSVENFSVSDDLTASNLYEADKSLTADERESLEIQELSGTFESECKESCDDPVANKTLDPNDCQNANNLSVLCQKEERGRRIPLMEGIEPLDNVKPISNVCNDDIPISSPKKDFHTLLEEKLRDHEAKLNADVNITVKAKRPFLKKGQGLSRFRMQPNSLAPLKQVKSCKISSQSQSTKDTKGNSTAVCNNHSKKNVPATSSSQQEAKNVSLTKRNISKPQSMPMNKRTDKSKNVIELNVSDIDSKTQKELEEMRIFELLEEKAENSSFCSTSSAIVAFLQQSTPFKMKKSSAKANVVNVESKKDTLFGTLSGSSDRMITETKDSYIRYSDDPVVSDKKQSQVSTKEQNRLQNTTSVKSNCIANIATFQDHTLRTQSFSNPCNENDNDNDVSLHVRFSEYNEYKTIGLTDTSSEESSTKNYADEKAWSDYSVTSDSSDTEMSLTHNSNAKMSTIQKRTQCRSVQYPTRELDYETKHGHHENIVSKNLSRHQSHKEESESDVSEQTSDEEQLSSLHQKVENETVKSIQKPPLVNQVDDTVFKSELLKNRLLELEQEIDIFRKENAALAVQRQKLQEEQKTLRKEYMEKEKKMKEYREKMEERFQEERKKLLREKAALENRMRDSQEKAQQNKVERQEIQRLKQQLEELKDEMNIKESRWNAAESRHRSQMRILKVENSKLKQEIERLENLRNGNSKNRKTKTTSNTRAIHRISRQLDEQENVRTKQRVNKNTSLSNDEDEDKMCESMMKVITEKQDYKMTDSKTNDDNLYNNSSNVLNMSQEILRSNQNISRKRDLYESLLKDATASLREIHCNSEGPRESSNEEKENKERVFTLSSSSDERNDKKSSDTHLTKNSPVSDSKTIPSEHTRKDSQTNKQDIKQIEHPDGRIEYWYPNGNVRKVFPKQGITKMIYYNGDVREIEKDGKVRYFYASTRTWHTSMPDGLEILEFPDGQVERRSRNGIIEITFPDGSVKIVQSDGSEKCALPDGTVAQTLANGEKVLALPNGQREIHTKDHKRREYPDGTVKFVYPDGTQETRYSNGRVRLKDKDGNLVMDSYH